MAESVPRALGAPDSYPLTIVVRHPREKPQKCSILPLKGRPDLIFVDYPPKQILHLAGYVRLAVDGPQLGPLDRASGILLLDASWRRAIVMNESFAHVPPRSLSGFRTAYPRRSQKGTDPEQGLASVEALYIAHHLLGRPKAGLLDHYYWAEEFLLLNAAEFASEQNG